MDQKSTTIENAPSAARSDRRATVLVVEDSPVQAELLRRSLEEAGYQVIVAGDGAEGLAMAKKHHPDAVVSDINMPVMDGYSMCSAFRAEASLQSTPVILLTMLSESEDVIRGLNAGADAYLTKPYNIPSLVARIASLLACPPVPPPAAERKKVKVQLADETYFVDSDGPRMLSLLISTYENAVLQNRDLAATQSALEDLNQHLEQKVLEKTAALRASEQNYRTLADAAPALIWASGTDKLCNYFNRPWLQFTGRSLEQELGNGWTEGVHADDFAQCLATYNEAFDRRQPFSMEYRLRRHDGEFRWIRDDGCPRCDSNGEFIGYLGYVMDITEHKRVEEALRKSEKDLKEAQHLAKIGSWNWDTATDTITWSEEYYRIYGFDPAQRPPGYADHLQAYTPESAARLDAAVNRNLRTGEPYEIDLELARSDGPRRWITARSETRRDAEGKITGLRGTAQDITERKHAELALERANRALRSLSACNEALVRAETEAELLDSICRLIVETGGYRMAWVGVAECDAAKTVRPVAHYGHDEGYLAAARVSWADVTIGRGPIGTSIRTGTTQVNQNISTHLQMAPWRDAALARGYQANIALPLKINSEIFGALAIYASEADAFAEDEVRLLGELAADLAFGIETLRTRAERDRIAREHQHHAEELRQSLEDSIKAVAGTLEMRDPYTAGHQRRVGQLAVAISRELGLPEETIHGIELAASIHDLGKISVPADILSKPSKLTRIEFKLIQGHAQSGYDILKDIKFPWPIATMVLQHHERLDGSGYPQGLKNGQILIESRIMAVADVVEAMASHRPYRAALGIDAALGEIERGRDTLYDAAVADACVRLFAQQRFAFCD